MELDNGKPDDQVKERQPKGRNSSGSPDSRDDDRTPTSSPTRKHHRQQTVEGFRDKGSRTRRSRSRSRTGWGQGGAGADQREDDGREKVAKNSGKQKASRNNSSNRPERSGSISPGNVPYALQQRALADSLR